MRMCYLQLNVHDQQSSCWSCKLLGGQEKSIGSAKSILEGHVSATLKEEAGQSEGRAAQSRVGHLHRGIGAQSHTEQVWVAMQSVHFQL